MGVWQVRGRWVIGISGRCSAQSVGKPPLTGNFIGANVRWRILNPLNFCHRTILLDRNSSVWADTHGTLVGGWAELICGLQATNRSMAGSYKSAFRSVSGHPPASVEGGYNSLGSNDGMTAMAYDMSVISCQITGHSSVCWTVWSGRHWRNIRFAALVPTQRASNAESQSISWRQHLCSSMNLISSDASIFGVNQFWPIANWIIRKKILLKNLNKENMSQKCCLCLQLSAISSKSQRIYHTYTTPLCMHELVLLIFESTWKYGWFHNRSIFEQ